MPNIHCPRWIRVWNLCGEAPEEPADSSGNSAYAGNRIYSRLAAEFLQENPHRDIQFAFHTGDTQHLLDELEAGKHDLAFCSRPAPGGDLLPCRCRNRSWCSLHRKITAWPAGTGLIYRKLFPILRFSLRKVRVSGAWWSRCMNRLEQSRKFLMKQKRTR